MVTAVSDYRASVRLLFSGRYDHRHLPALAESAAAGLAAEAAPTLAQLLTSLSRRRRNVHAKAAIAAIGEKQRWILAIGESGYCTHLSDLGLGAASREAILGHLEGHSELVLGEFDQDGLLCSPYGRIDGLPGVSPEEATPRRRYRLELIVGRDQRVGVRKTFVGSPGAFLAETMALHRLGQAGCNVPAILELDLEALALTMSLVQGDVLRERLVQCGAAIRDRDVEGELAWSGLTPDELRLERIALGRQYVDKAVGPDFIDRLFEEIQRAHSCGVFGVAGKYGNIVVERSSGEPFLIDFEEAVIISPAERVNPNETVVAGNQ